MAILPSRITEQKLWPCPRFARVRQLRAILIAWLAMGIQLDLEMA